MISGAGVLSSETVDKLYDKKHAYIQNGIDFLKNRKDIHRLSKTTGLPNDALDVLRLADIKSSRPPREQEQVVRIETAEMRIKALESWCEKHGLEQPSLQGEKSKTGETQNKMFLSLVKRIQDPYLEYKKSDSI